MYITFLWCLQICHYSPWDSIQISFRYHRNGLQGLQGNTRHTLTKGPVDLIAVRSVKSQIKSERSQARGERGGQCHVHIRVDFCNRQRRRPDPDLCVIDWTICCLSTWVCGAMGGHTQTAREQRFKCMYVCMYACMNVCMHACMYMSIHRKREQKYESFTQTSSSIPEKYVWMYVCMHIYVHTQKRAQKYKSFTQPHQAFRRSMFGCPSRARPLGSILKRRECVTRVLVTSLSIWIL